MLNYIWLGLILLAVGLGGSTGHLKEVGNAAFDAAKAAVVNLALPLMGVMTLWLGLMRLADRAGLVQLLARALQPVMSWLFPDVPAGHPAIGSMLMNVSANMLGLGNAATPLGLKAMKDLERLNPHPGTATNAMCTFLAINTSSLQLIPASTIAILAAAQSLNPSAIVGTALMSTTIAAVVALTSVKLLQNLPFFAASPAAAPASQPAPEAAPAPAPAADPSPASRRGVATPFLIAGMVLLVGCFGWWFVDALRVAPPSIPPFARAINAVSLLAIPFLIAFMTLFAALRGVKVYEEFIEGAKEGFETGVRIIPYLVAMLVAVGMFREAGGVAMITKALSPLLNLIHFPSELVPLALMRPLSGSGANGIFADLVKTYGPDSLLARTAGTLIGSTETTFYVLAVYFGSVGIKRTRHAVVVGLLGDLAGILASVIVCRLVFRPGW